MKSSIFALASMGIMTLLAVTAAGSSQSMRAIDHAVSIVQRPDGSYDVTCMDGLVELKTRADILANHLCEHLHSFAGHWVLIEGGIQNGSRVCDLDISLVRSSTSMVKLKAGFSSPCTKPAVETQQCQGLTCSLAFDDKYYSFDFSTAGRMTMTRLDDSFTAVYRGNGGSGNGSLGTARTTELGGVPNILQNSNDGGATWHSACDDNFGPSEANVACREMGYSRADRYLNSVSVSGDADYGWDDLSCTGNESSLEACSHTPWTQHNCDSSEHVQLTCLP